MSDSTPTPESIQPGEPTNDQKLVNYAQNIFNEFVTKTERIDVSTYEQMRFLLGVIREHSQNWLEAQQRLDAGLGRAMMDWRKLSPYQREILEAINNGHLVMTSKLTNKELWTIRVLIKHHWLSANDLGEEWYAALVEGWNAANAGEGDDGR